MAKQPDFDAWSKWYQKTNMSTDEVRLLAEQGKLSYHESDMLMGMIDTGHTFKDACNTWNGAVWQYCRAQVTTSTFPGNNSSKELREEPSRDQLSLGVIEDTHGALGIIENSRGDGAGVDGPRQGDGGAAICRCPACGYWEVHERGEPCNSIMCPACGSAMRGE